MLVTQASETDLTRLSDYRDTAWLARDHALTVLPSVGALRALRKFASGTSAVAPFVGIGNPVLEGTSGPARGIKLAGLFRGAIADVAAVRRLPPPPETADGLRVVAKAMGVGDRDLYLGDRACAKPGVEICNNGLDDDEDGRIDCADLQVWQNLRWYGRATGGRARQRRTADRVEDRDLQAQCQLGSFIGVQHRGR